MLKRGQVLPVCPEALGGLPVPRPPSEVVTGLKEKKVKDIFGRDVTRQFESGAFIALEIGLGAGCNKAILKARSPSCGFGQIYDGTFSHKLVQGNGVFAELLKSHGFDIFTEDTFAASYQSGKQNGARRGI